MKEELAYISGTPAEHPAYSPDLAPYDFWAFSMLTCQPGQKFSNDTEAKTRSCCYPTQDVWKWPTVCFKRGWATEKNVQHVKGVTLINK
jgi:hypothetical protein